ncbi:DUF4432 family protein [Leptolyngbya sp. FACHB-36]|uniref:DUF4432 family protein n=1 Tax=Leptolyngbya sp. FACHB-36 TaxID=2692808 RepID=UPI0016807490|nr:DUF4432 family protein [Leptolyngbya sp. FACHB-36]MBD2022085.1 DUF4432 family protein [Leptolyngbya sp. FACHB-36]
MLILENHALSLTVRPDLGGRIDQLHDRQTGQAWLWHPPGYDSSQARSLPIGASFDEHWSGGWDEIFPNDAAGPFRGRDLVDHGEFWSQAWTVVDASSTQVSLRYVCQTLPVAVEKIIQLDETQPQATIHYRFENQSDDTLPFLFKQHAAIAIDAGDEILLPDCLIEPVVLDFSKRIGRAEKTRFPNAFDAEGNEIQVQHVPPRSSQLQEFWYSSNLAHGECGIRKGQSALLMTFDTTDFPYVWVFQSYGGWNGRYVIVLEPCTTMPYDLEVAYQNGTVAQLKPREIQHRHLSVKLQS